MFSQKKLLAAIAEKSGADENTVQAVLTSFSEVVLTEVMSNDKSVRVKGLGTFKMKVRNARKGRNPRTGKSSTNMNPNLEFNY